MSRGVAPRSAAVLLGSQNCGGNATCVKKHIGWISELATLAHWSQREAQCAIAAAAPAQGFWESGRASIHPQSTD